MAAHVLSFPYAAASVLDVLTTPNGQSLVLALDTDDNARPRVYSGAALGGRKLAWLDEAITSFSGVLTGEHGGTGVANTGKSITLGGNLTLSGAFALTLTQTGATNVTLPTTGTLATLAGAESLSNKTLVAPILGTPASGTLTNCAGLPIGSGVSGLGTGVATWLAAPSSANLAAALTGETGTGGVVFDTGPTISGPLFSGMTAGSVFFAGASGLLSQNNVGMNWDNSGKIFRASANTVAPTAPPAGTPFHVVGNDTQTARVTIDSFAGAGANITSRAARGTAASPSALLSNDPIFVMAAFGYGATGYSDARCQHLMYAAENWSDSAQGTYQVFTTTAIGSTTNTERGRITDTGRLGWGNTIPQALADFGTTNGEVRIRKLFTDASNGAWGVIDAGQTTSDTLTIGSRYNGSGSGVLTKLGIVVDNTLRLDYGVTFSGSWYTGTSIVSGGDLSAFGSLRLPVPMSAPASPAAGWALYVDSGDGNKLKAKASTGTVVTLGTP